MVSFESTTFGSLATVMCDDGYILLGGDETRICYNGVWSDSDPTCNCKYKGQVKNWVLIFLKV